MNDDVPEFGDVEGLTRLYERAVVRIRRMDIDKHIRDAWLAELGWQFDQAIVGGSTLGIEICRRPPGELNVRPIQRPVTDCKI
jgi:hypothetical protein